MSRQAAAANLRATTRRDLASRIARRTPIYLRIQASAVVEEGPRQFVRDRDERRRYAGDPWAYISDKFQVRLTRQQSDALEFMERYDRVLLPSANNAGKTMLLACYGNYRFDAVAALPDEDRGLEEQGGQILLPGPDASTIFSTLYSAMLELAEQAERTGNPMPGERSDKSVLWRVRPRWFVEPFSPPARVGRRVAHTASGRHHRNQVALIEEGQGVLEHVWLATEGMCSAAGNKIISSFNPTETSGPAYKRSSSGAYHVMHLSAFDHPNVKERRDVIPPAVDFRLVDKRVRTECQDRGTPGTTPLDPDHHDFTYALPPLGSDGDGLPRTDGIVGDARGTPRVYRPSADFTAQVLGQWPAQSDGGLFSAAAIDAAMVRGRMRLEPDEAPDAVGFDAAREGADDATLAPRWGEDAEALLRAYADATEIGTAEIEELKAHRRQVIGEIRVLPKGDGVDTARAAARHFPDSPFHTDIGSQGASSHDHLSRVLGKQSIGVSFAAVPPVPTPGEPWSENLRTAMYVRFSRLLSLGLVDLPYSPKLREELLAHSTIPKSRTIEERGNKKRVPSQLLIPKDEVKRAIGRSPDDSDAVVLASNGFPQPKRRPVPRYGSVVSFTG